MSILSLPRTIATVFALAVVLPLLGGCAADKQDTYKELPVEELYNNAMDLLKDEEYDKAAKAFDEVERQHPYSVWATKAQLMSAYSHYVHNKFDDAISSLDRFIQLHPGHKDVAYAYYLKALCYYEQIADVTRDQKMTDNALKSLQEVVDRFPNSKYARDAKLKVDLARDHLAGKEMAIGRWYQGQQQYLAAINRYRVVVDNFQTTTHVPEALERLTECYETLGLTQEARNTAAVLGFNYPGDQWYSDTYNLVEGITPDIPKPKQSGWFDWW
ncbi:outer membrane protein assembly factor BamD [Telmatospirillum siberiense]|uniref:Outer membrane protein assembly factor BamD n=1 Tax=Telmatospirillum siberiense TaxID=382514 RepID=A0A2N3PQL7_9PROT|nr:outer membrane protein assembly factor BamD [Telmatospirillum siberiense]PKU22696.1 outer membrane protein assembly factor BamD [Telmatospirillum siberiense]